MDGLHADCDKFFSEVDHLDRILDSDDLDQSRIELALSQAKRVRRESNLVVRSLAKLRDQLQPKEAQAK
jgi:hypothetical protein